MKDVIAQIVKGGRYVHFPDCGFLGIDHILLNSGFIREIDERDGTFCVVIYHDDYRNYKLSEYNKWIFSTKEEAMEAIEKLPKNGGIVYQIIDGAIVEQQVKCYHNHYGGLRIDLYIVLEDGTEISINEVGQTLFQTYEDAAQHLK